MSDNIASIQPHNHLFNVRETDIFLALCQPTILQPEIVSSFLFDIFFSADSTQQSFADERETGHTVETVSHPDHTSDRADQDTNIWYFEEIPNN